MFRAHQVPIGNARTDPGHQHQLKEQMCGYRPEELFDDRSALAALAPRGDRRMGASPHARSGISGHRDLRGPA